MTATDPAAATRRSLHGIAELVLAGPQYRASGTIRLRVSPGGFGTITEPSLRVEGDQLVAGARRVPLPGTTCAQLADAIGIEAGAPEGLYHDGSGMAPDEPIVFDVATAAAITTGFERGDDALRRFAPGTTPVLWPEHFDVGITVDAVNYGISPGDGYLSQPYAYVGPHEPRKDPFWNAPFGAARTLAELGDDLVMFFREGHQAAAKTS